MRPPRSTTRWRPLLAALVAALAAPAEAVTVALDDVVIERGASGAVSAALAGEAASVAGVAVEIRLAAGLVPVLREDGAPDCVAAPATGKQAFARARRERGPLCLGPYDCNVLRVLVLSLGDSAPIPDGLLFTCAVAVNPAATIFALPLRVVTASASDPAGLLLSVAASDGLVTVPMPPTATPFDTATPTPTWTPGAYPTTTGEPGGIRTRKPTKGRAPTATLVLPPTTATATATQRGGGGGGCAVTPHGEPSLVPLLAALALLLARRQ